MKAHTLLLASVLAFSVVHASDQKEGVAPVTRSDPLGSEQTTGPSTPQFLPGIVVIEGSASEGTTRTPESAEYAYAPDHPKRLWDFTCEVFEPKLETICGSPFDPKSIVKRFGEHVKDFRTWPEHSRDPTIQNLIATAWDYEGLTIVALSYATIYGPHMWIKSISITSPDYQLKHQLKVGLPYSKFVEVLGRPRGKSRRRDKIAYYNDSMQVSLTIDDEKRVTKVIVSYGSTH